MDDMGTFRITIEIEDVKARGPRRELEKTLVDTGAELTWAPRDVLESLGIQREKTIKFWMADGRAVHREVGYAIVHAAGVETVDEVVFAEPGDLILLGARSLEGMNLRVDPREKRLVAGGPMDAAAARPRRSRLARRPPIARVESRALGFAARQFTYSQFVHVPPRPPTASSSAPPSKPARSSRP